MSSLAECHKILARAVSIAKRQEAEARIVNTTIHTGVSTKDLMIELQTDPNTSVLQQYTVLIELLELCLKDMSSPFVGFVNRTIMEIIFSRIILFLELPTLKEKQELLAKYWVLQKSLTDAPDKIQLPLKRKENVDLLIQTLSKDADKGELREIFEGKQLVRAHQKLHRLFPNVINSQNEIEKLVEMLWSGKPYKAFISEQFRFASMAVHGDVIAMNVYLKQRENDTVPYKRIHVLTCTLIKYLHTSVGFGLSEGDQAMLKHCMTEDTKRLETIYWELQAQK